MPSWTACSITASLSKSAGLPCAHLIPTPHPLGNGRKQLKKRRRLTLPDTTTTQYPSPIINKSLDTLGSTSCCSIELILRTQWVRFSEHKWVRFFSIEAMSENGLLRAVGTHSRFP